MKLSIAMTLSSFASITFSAYAETTTVYRPHKIAFGDLVDDRVFTKNARASFLDALSHVGMVSVTDIPGMQNKKDVLSKIHACAMESAATQEHTFPDGTLRRTMATHTVPGPGGVQTIDHKTSSSACDSFSKAIDPFRKTVAEVTETFATRLSSILEPTENAPLLSTEHGYVFDTVADVVENGEHLEHFHSYQSMSQDNPVEETIDLHIDQGLFLVFTPGRLVKQESKTSTLTEGFYIEHEDGSRSLVHFDEDDDLVFMLGDGVNQYVNLRLNKNSLRATPHALVMPRHAKDEARVWYGRMVLPPSDAVHPEHEKTFGELRKFIIDASLSGEDQEKLGLGCSSNMMARNLEETTCEAGTIYCWSRCMNTTEHGVSEEICADQNLDLACINPRSQVYTKGHGDYYPGCIDTAIAPDATPYPELPNYPRDESACTDEMFESFASSTGYDHKVDLGAGAILMWSVDANGQIDGKLAFDGIFGYLALGFSSIGGKKNGMHGATIIMALPGGDYSAVDGLDLTQDPTIMEYVIDPQLSAFRHWMSPVSSASREASSYAVTSNDCFTAMTFKTDSIHTIPFNVTGSDDLVWAANSQDYYAGYHGSARGRFVVDWVKGAVTLSGANEGNATSAAVPNFSSSLVPMLAFVAGLGFQLLYI